MDNLYNVWISPKHSFKKKKQLSQRFYIGLACEIMAIRNLLQKSSSEIKVLDFGMGWGLWCLMARAFGFEVFGLEYARDRIAFARAHNIPIVNLDNITNHKFDFINAEQVFEHLHQPLETLKKLVNALNSKGILRIAVPDGTFVNKNYFSNDWVAVKNAVQPLEHINCFNHSSLIRLGLEAGLKPIPLTTFISRNITTPRNILRRLIYGNTIIYFALD